MKASIFIKTALIDQMQQIADLGLWFHLAKLIPPGVELLGVVVYGMGEELEDEGYLRKLVRAIYGDFFPRTYPFFPTSVKFYSRNPQFWLTHTPECAEKHLHLFDGEKEGGAMVLHQFYCHVPTWFADFKNACQAVLGEIEAGKIEDIEVLKTGARSHVVAGLSRNLDIIVPIQPER